eukprot:scaffold166330_cov26-Prasinocladus_malaysianus.AAC.1
MGAVELRMSAAVGELCECFRWAAGCWWTYNRIGLGSGRGVDAQRRSYSCTMVAERSNLRGVGDVIEK